MKQVALISLAFTISLFAGTSLANEPKIISPNAKVPYLGVNGKFTLDTSVPSSLHDPRNPARIVFNQMKSFSFYRDLAGRNPIAENCEYVYRGAAPDPFYYPKFQTSIWDLFELVPGKEACSGFKYVALRSPHGEPVHMHFRYGGENSSFKTILSQSTGESDPKKLNPWWSLYCAEGVTACDQ